MVSWAFGYLLGSLSLFIIVDIVEFKWIFTSFALLIIITPKVFKQLRLFLSAILLGSLLVYFHANTILAWTIPQNLETKDVLVKGIVSSLPEIANGTAQFELTIDQFNAEKVRTKLRLSWYHYPPQFNLQSGNECEFKLRLKAAHGQLNPGGFDYETWLFSKRIRATGYVVSSPGNHCLSPSTWTYPVNKLRQYLENKINAALANQVTAGLITALVMGSQHGISADQWRVMRATGTNHLLAIAGVHIGFVAGFIYLLVNFLWRRSPRLMLAIPAMIAASMAALFAAILYSALAGFALPTQRALVMLSVAMLGILLRRELSLWSAFFLALTVLLIYDPFIVLSTSFWLSFVAVATILWANSGRINPQGWWWHYGRLQWSISIGLLPLSLLLFGQASLISFVANLFAVPAVGFLVLPLCLSGSAVLVFFPWLGKILLILSAKIMLGIWWVLTALANMPEAVWQQSMPNFWILISISLAALIILAPRGFPGRWLGLCCLFPVIFYQPAAPHKDEVWLHVLDIGQGLAVVAQTQRHTLVFDTGLPLGEFDDSGKRSILPFLNASGLKKIDMLVVSHGDSDHIGGAHSLLEALPVDKIFSSVPEKFQPRNAQFCQRGQVWQWDGIDFSILYPPPELLHLNNNSSCVLKIGQGRNAILLTGDIEKLAEEYLVEYEYKNLPATALVAPHHGSLTSSTPDLVSAVQPIYVIFSTGYKNRFHFPSPVIVNRYKSIASFLFNTADSGAVKIVLNNRIGVTEVEEFRKKNWRFWFKFSSFHN